MDNINNFDDVYSTISKCKKIIDLQEQLIKNQDIMISNLNTRVDILSEIIAKQDRMIELLNKRNA